MFRRLFNRGTGKTKLKKKKKNNFKRWFKGAFKRKPKEIAPSVTTLFRNKIKESKLNIRDIELIDGISAKELKKRFSVTGSRGKVLQNMVADYKQGKLSLPGLSHKSKFDAKSLDKYRLNEMIEQYEEGTRKRRSIDEAQKNVKFLKKKFNMTESQASKLDRLIIELNQGKGSNVHLVKTLLDPNTLTKERVEKFIKQYEEAEKKNRGLSYIKLSLISSTRKIQNLMEDVKAVKGFSGILKKYV